MQEHLPVLKSGAPSNMPHSWSASCVLTGSGIRAGHLLGSILESLPTPLSCSHWHTPCLKVLSQPRGQHPGPLSWLTWAFTVGPCHPHFSSPSLHTPYLPAPPTAAQTIFQDHKANQVLWLGSSLSRESPCFESLVTSVMMWGPIEPLSGRAWPSVAAYACNPSTQ
jgi:hypothetical protein